MNAMNFNHSALVGGSTTLRDRATAAPLNLAAFAPPTTRLRSGSHRVFGIAIAGAAQAALLAGLIFSTSGISAPPPTAPMEVSILPQTEKVKPPTPPMKPIMTPPNVIINMPPTFQIHEPPPVVAAPAPPAPDALATSSVPVSANAAAVVENYQISLLRHLTRHKRYPSGARAKREQGVVYVRFAMDRRGNVLSAAIEKSGRFADLDSEGLALLSRAQPLPTPPVEVAGDPIEMIVPVEFSLKK